MQALELKIPPPLVGVIVASAMWGISLTTPLLAVPATDRLLIAIVIAIVGLVLTIAGSISFHQAHTTVNPMQPSSASSLVSFGVYQFTRNPMYLGLLILLAAWAVFLSSPGALLGLLAFFFYIDRFQIVPEEQALAKLFGTDYVAYQTKVRRWI